MTTTPTIWKNFTANFDSLPGLQLHPSAAAFADGSFIVTWTDDTKGSSPGADIFAQRFDAEGNAQGGAFQINTVSTARQEFPAHVAALPDGGMVIAYAVNNSTEDIVIERRDASGRVVHTDTLNDVLNSFGGFGIAVAANGDYAVQFVQEYDDGIPIIASWDQDVHGFVYDFETNARSKRFDVAVNGDDSDYASGMTALAGGGFAYLSFGSDSDFKNVNVKLIDNDGRSMRGSVTVGEGQNAAIAGLTDGNFVVTYERDGNIFFRVMNPEAGASAELVAAQNITQESEPEITHLLDGGFFIAWFDTDRSEVRGQRFDASGAAVGETIVATSGLGPVFLNDFSDRPHLDVSLTADGRILLSVEDGFSGIRDVLLDPRDDTISGTGGNDVLTTRLTSTTVFAGDGDDKVLGQKGSDTIHGEGGNDILQGGGGIDTIDGGDGNDIVVLRENHASDVIDGGSGRDMLDLHNVAGRAAVVDLGSGSWLMTPGFIEDTIIIEPTRGNPGSSLIPAVARGITGIEIVSGTQMGDRFTGSAASETLIGNGGDDTLSGAGGIDLLNGGIGKDTMDGGAASDRLIGFDGDDDMRGGAGAGADILLGGGGADKLTGGRGGDTFSGGLGSDQFIYGSILDGGDRVTDFSSITPEADDIFLFDGGEFGGLNSGALNANRFEANSAGQATRDTTRFVYDTDDGILTFDANGAANGGVTVIATLQAGAVLTINDIAIF